MKKNAILIVTDRSNYFSFIGDELEKVFKVFYIAVRKEDEDILQKIGKPFISRQDMLRESSSASSGKGIFKDQDLRESLFCDIEYDRLYNNGKKLDLILKNGQAYANKIDGIMRTNKIGLVIVQNDSWDYSSIPIAVARKNGISTLIFEDGFFRPDTIVLDSKGVNQNNSCPRAKDFYEDIPINKNMYSEFINNEMLKGSGPLVDIFSGINLSNFIKRSFSFLRHPRKVLRTIPLLAELVAFLSAHSSSYGFCTRRTLGYIIVPLQVRSDSQIICHSPIKSMEQFLSVCFEAVEKYNKRHTTKLSVVIKEHPKDPHMNILWKTRKCDIRVNNYYLTKVNIRRLIEGCTAIVTINSTVGIEGLLYHKPVITLGQAFYNIDGICCHCDDLSKLDIAIEEATKKPVDYKLIDNFLYYLKFHYQVDGDLNNPDQKNIRPVISKITDIMNRT